MPLPDTHLNKPWCFRRRSSVPCIHKLRRAAINSRIYCIARRHTTGVAPLYQRALTMYETNLGPDHPDVADVLCNWSSMLTQQGHYAQARPLLQRALAIIKKEHGPNHAEAVGSLQGLAALHREEGRYAEALPLFQQVLAIREATPEHPEKLTQALRYLGETFCSLGNLSAARPLLERALAMAEATFGPSHVQTGTVLNSLGNLLVTEGNATAALAVFQRALTVFEAAHVPNHPNVAAVSINIARLLEQQPEQRTQARALLKRARDINAASRPDHEHHSLAAQEYAHMRATQPCRTCSQTGKWEKCGRCQNEWYCSAACQKADWRRHKTECHAAAAAAPAETAAPPGV